MRGTKHLLLWTSLGTFLVLAFAAFSENVLAGWRRLQRAAAERLPAGTGLEIHLRQVVVPQTGAIDRCTTCHLGMQPGESTLVGDPLLKAHPPVVHDPAGFGCTVCHGGQGRATTTADAHGNVPHWPEPMLPRRYLSAGCGTCHTHLAVPRLEALERGRAVFERTDCLACHRVSGRGGTMRPGGAGGAEGPDLSTVGIRGFRADWHEHHVAEHEKAAEGPWRSAFAPLPPADREALGAYLTSLVGAPGLVEAKALFHTLGCRGCHAVGGVGGSDGPDLTRAGMLDPGQRSFVGVSGPRTVPGWLAEHFRAPARVTAGSLMPEMALSEERIDQLVLYVLSLRRAPLSQALWPTDRLRSERLGEREFSTDGATLYGTFCAACHGQSGEGMRYPGLAAFPAVGSPDFLSLACDDFLAETVKRGRPGRRMPPWGDQLRPAEVTALVGHLRALGGVECRKDPRPPRWARGDVAEGGRIYASACAGCHGPKGEGGEGPMLANPVLQKSATDGYLADTIGRGRRGTGMAGFSEATPSRPALSPEEIESVVTFLRTWETKP
ncbi:MAG TPA: c-type cytochrome [Anaeromyxobacteraceae bacterium]|nr:c-type cytochrome [Anaeromyxobacteraceae bacterium]